MQNIDKNEFKKLFPGCKYGQECSKKISKYVIDYKLEKKKNKVCNDYVVLHTVDYKQPIPDDILQEFLEVYKFELATMCWKVTFKNDPESDNFVQYHEVVEYHMPVFAVYFTRLEEIDSLKFFLSRI